MDQKVKEKFDQYPKNHRAKLMAIRKLIFEVAKEDKVGELSESLKWGQPSYNCEAGSAVRFDWKPNFPDQYAIYFNCRTKLVETFREVYGDLFVYEGNRAIVLGINQKLSERQLQHCISMSLRYKKIRHLPLLGA